MSGSDLIECLSRELGAVVGALLAVDTTIAPSSSSVDEGWQVRIAAGGRLTGHVALRFDAERSRTLARLIIGLEAQPPDPAVAETLQEICAQALAAVSVRPESAGVRLTASAAEWAGGPPPSPRPVQVFEITTTLASLAGALTFAIDGDLKEVRSAVAPAVDTPTTIDPDRNLDVVLDIELPLTVRFGETELTFDALSRIGPGTVIDLARAPDDPVEVLVNDKIVARGEVVVAAGHYGVRITEVVSSAERMRTAQR